MRLLAAALLLAVVPAARADDVMVQVGDAAIRIPVDGGYVRESLAWPEGFAETSKKVTPASRLVEYFLTPEQIKEGREGHQPTGVYYQVVVQRAVENSNIGQADWKALQARAAGELARVDMKSSDEQFNRDEQARRKSGIQSDQATITATAEPVVYRQTPMSFEFSSVTDADVSDGGTPEHRRIAVTGAVVLAHNRLVQVSAYLVIDKDSPEATLATLRTRFDSLVDSVAALNPSKFGDPRRH